MWIRVVILNILVNIIAEAAIVPSAHAESARTVDPTCDEDATRAILGVDQSFSVWCARLSSGVWLHAGVREQPPRNLGDRLAIRWATTRQAATLASGELVITPAHSAEAFTWLEVAEVHRLSVGVADTGARISVFGRTGEDFRTNREVALLLRVEPAGAIRLVWVGLGTTITNSMDECVVVTRAEFEVTGAEVVRRLRSTTWFRPLPGRTNQEIEQRRRECRAAPPQDDRFPLVR